MTGLRVTGSVLALGRAAFLPEGLRVDGATFGWDHVSNRGYPVETWPGEPATGWMLHVVPQTLLGQPTTAFGISWLGVDRPDVRIGRRHALPATPSARSAVRAAALASYLRDEPRARPGLAEPAKLAALVTALRRVDQSGGPHEPLLGDAYDLHWAVVRGYRAAFPRRYADLHVAGDVPAGDAVALCRAHLPARLRARAGDEEITARLRRYVARAWPFAVLG